MTGDIAQCPECGWTGDESDLEVDGSARECPVCGYTLRRV